MNMGVVVHCRPFRVVVLVHTNSVGGIEQPPHSHFLKEVPDYASQNALDALDALAALLTAFGAPPPGALRP